ncbi:uncharacterized protein A4U43_C02F760 [Asparagus officinalis]|uniref:Major facilitator superfamily (MFS) profile domain-containing protein n=1 Tax=Asparagus officinalis TaxID=4686 RepID=A0A5P1FES7_ASPOF|nr:protein NRT1/ PTR FAMILY 5.6 [Asparagus officinalis]ONK76875.1 uncharacterized protein A4U43_C02F760 [Asparagus officinalis]
MDMRKELEADEEKWVSDSSVDHKGRTPLRASTGVWRASLFIIAIEFSERLSYFGLATNLIIYLTKVLHQDVKTAAKNVNYWIGVTTIMPLFGGFVADAYLGRFSTVLMSTLIYLLGLVLLTLSQLVPNLKPSRSLRVHEIVFFVAIYLISVGTGGHKPSLESFGADQFDDNHADERRKKMSYFNWWNCGICAGVLLGVTVIVFVQDNVSWGTADIVLSVVMGISLVIFLIGKPFYRYRIPEGSPLTPMIQVLVASFAKRHLPYPSDPSELYEQKTNKRLLCHTDQFRFLDRAAIIEQKTNVDVVADKWRLATVTQVEELKLLLSVIPIWVASLPFGICVAQASTFFIKQGSIMNRKITANLEIPPAALYSFAAISMIISVSFYDKMLVPLLRKITRNERGITILQRMGIGMMFSVLSMVVSALIEKKRLNVHSMSVFWLVPQFTILGIADGFTVVGLQEYFYDQLPDSMRSLGIAFYLGVMGASNFLSSFLISAVDNITERGGGDGWFAKDLNKSRIDCFYWLLAGISGLNLGVYAYVATRYSYKKVKGQGRVGVGDTFESEDGDHCNANVQGSRV